MGKKNRQKLDIDNIDFEESSYYDSEEDYENSRSSKKNKKDKRRDRRNNYDYYGDNGYDDYGDNSSAFEGYSDQDDDLYDSEDSYEEQDDEVEEQDEYEEESEYDDRNSRSERFNSVSESSHSPGYSQQGSFSSGRTDMSRSSSSNEAMGDSSMFRETSSQQKSANSSSSNNSLRPSFSFSTGNKAPLRPTPKTVFVEERGRERDSKKALSEISNNSHDDAREEFEEEKNNLKKRDKDVEEKERLELERERLKERLDNIDMEILELDESVNEDDEDRSLVARKRKLEKERLTLLIKRTQWDLDDCVALREESGDDESLANDEAQLREELKRLKSERRNLLKGSFLPLTWASGFGRSIKSRLGKIQDSLKNLTRRDSDQDGSDQGIEEEETQGVEDMGNSKRKKKQRKSPYEELEGNSIDSSDGEEFGDVEDYPQSLGERNWRGIFKRTAITVTAISLLLTIGYSGWLIYGGQKKDKDATSVASVTKDNGSNKVDAKSGALQKSDSKGDKLKASGSKSSLAKNENTEKKEGGLWNRVKNLVSWKKSDKDKEQAKKIQNNDKTAKGKVAVQQKELSKNSDDPLLKNDNLKNESSLVKFAKDTNDSLNSSVQDASALTNSATEEIVADGANLLDSANDVVDDVVDDFTDVAENFEETADNLVEQASNADQDLLNESGFVNDSDNSTEGELIVEADEPYEGVSSSSYPNSTNSTPQVADPVATFGETLPRTDDTVGLHVSSGISSAPTSTTPNVGVPTTTASSDPSAPSGAEWDDDSLVSNVATDQDSISSDDLVTSLEVLPNGVSGSYAVLDESPTLSAAKVEDNGWNGSLDDQPDSPNTFQASAPSLDIASSTNDNLLAADSTATGTLTLDDNSSNSGSLAINDRLDDTLKTSSLALDNVSNDSLLDGSLDVDAYSSNDFSGDADSNLLAPLATAGAPTVENGLDENEPMLSFTLPESSQSASSSVLDDSTNSILADEWSGASDESNSVLDADEDGSRVSRNLNAMSEQISGTLDDLSERSSTLTERLSSSAQDLQANVQSSLDSVNEKINSGLETVQSWSQQTSNGLTETSNNLTNSISSTIDSVDNGLRNTYDNVTNSLSNAYNNTLDSLQNAGNSLQSGYENVRNALSSGTSNSLQNGLDDSSARVSAPMNSQPSSDFRSLEGTSASGAGGNELTLNASDFASPSPLNTSGASPLVSEQGMGQNGLVNADGLENGGNVANVSDDLLLPANSVGVSNNYANAVGSNSNPSNAGPASVPNDLPNNYSGVENSNFANGFSQELPSYGGVNPNGTSSNVSVPVYGSSNVSPTQNGGAYSPNNNQYSQGEYYPNVDSRTSSNYSVGVPYANQNENVPYGNNASYANSRGYDANAYNPNSYNLTRNMPSNDASDWSAVNNARNNYSSYGYRSTNQTDAGTKTRYREYVTKEGDNLLTIAENELGSSSRWSEIKRLNNLRSGATYFEVGTRIKLPVSAKDD